MFGRYELRLSEEATWDLTPAQYHMLLNKHVKRQEVEIKQADRRTATVCMVLANIHRDRKEKTTPFEIEDFMPDYGQKAPKVQTPEEQAEILLKLFGGGKH